MADDVLGALGDREPSDRDAELRVRVFDADPARPSEVAQHLYDEEGVAFSPLVDDPAKLERRVLAGVDVDELGHGRRIERTERPPLEVMLATEIGKRRAQG